MLKKLLVFAITSGLAAKLYKSYARKQGSQASSTPTGPVDGAPRNSTPFPKTPA